MIMLMICELNGDKDTHKLMISYEQIEPLWQATFLSEAVKAVLPRRVQPARIGIFSAYKYGDPRLILIIYDLNCYHVTLQ